MNLYIKGLTEAAQIAAQQAADDAIAASAASDLDARLGCLAQQQRALAIETTIRNIISSLNPNRSDTERLNWFDDLGFENHLTNCWSLEMPKNQTSPMRNIRAAIDAQMDKTGTGVPS